MAEGDAFILLRGHVPVGIPPCISVTPYFPVPIVSFPQADVSLQQAVVSNMDLCCGRSGAIQRFGFERGSY